MMAVDMVDLATVPLILTAATGLVATLTHCAVKWSQRERIVKATPYSATFAPTAPDAGRVAVVVEGQ
jgi:hypothetical protein